ncbi:MAG TPA: radical SAM protein [bacterium]|nr:radical SAM protein [bacterium]
MEADKIILGVKIMKLEDIGFYTLSDKRANNSSIKSPLWRCELILNESCNFKCGYCRGIRKDIATQLGEGTFETLTYWIQDRLQNIRFSGGEPTLYRELPELVALCKMHGVKRIAVSTNGSADRSKYQELIDCGVNDFSVSLDACCSSGCDKMSGVENMWEKIIDNIRFISSQTYCTVGVVIDNNNINNFKYIISLADSLGVSDIRIIPSAQFNETLKVAENIPYSIIIKYPILKYRVDNILAGRHVRGIDSANHCKCWLAMDDMAVAGEYHFPCIIYMREHGDPIGKVNYEMRQDRMAWIKSHNPYQDPICSKNCLDVCVQYNKTCENYNDKP